MTTFDEQLATSLEALSDRIRANLDQARADLTAAAGADRQEAAGRSRPHLAQAEDQAAGERLVDAVRSISRSWSLSEILDTVASCAGRETARAAVLLVASGRFRGWRFIGFGPAFGSAGDIEF